MALPTLSGLTKSIYGTNASNGVSYSVTSVNQQTTVTKVKLEAVWGKINDERARRGHAAVAVGTTFVGKFERNDMTAMNTNLAVKGPGATQAYNGANQNINSSNGSYLTGYQQVITGYEYGTGVPIYGYQAVYGPVPSPEVITYPQVNEPSNLADFSGSQLSAQSVNDLITAINNAGAVCTCNCNYCTCNCNYCTCNCNYACTCHCNYSDERVKSDVEYM